MSILAAAAIALCAPIGERITCVHDGDSIVVERERIRIANIDAAELNGKCPSQRVTASLPCCAPALRSSGRAGTATGVFWRG